MAKANSKSEGMEFPNGTVVTTMTVVEDRTSEPMDRSSIEYHSKEADLGNGTILTTYHEPVGGFPGEEPEVA